MQAVVLLVEDEVGLADSLTTEFQFEDYEVLVAHDGQAAVTMFHQHQNRINLVVLDWMLPKLDGLGVLRRIRRESQVPVIMLTARSYVGDKVAGLHGGADDYLTKPFEIEELLARMEVALRRVAQTAPAAQFYQVGDLTLDVKTRQVMRQTTPLQLTQREYQLLLTLLAHADETCTREQLLNAVWGADFDGQPNVVDVYVRYLRHKVDAEGFKPLIHTVRGLGYCLSADLT